MEASVVQQDIRFSFPTQEETIFVLRYRCVVGQKLSDVQHLIRILYHVISLSGRLGAVRYQRQENAEAAILRAEAAVELARLNLSYTVVTAPCDGYLGRRSIEEGQLVSAGQTLTTIIPDTRKWVIANYKETQIASLSVGQEMEVTVDAFRGKTFKERITAISSATGSKYSMVPTDNSAGNFVKIQQRVPVRIELTDISDEDNARLAAGMMCVVKMKN